MVQLLPNQNADVNRQGGPHGNAPQAAVVGGHGEVVQRLLDKGAKRESDEKCQYGNAPSNI